MVVVADMAADDDERVVAAAAMSAVAAAAVEPVADAASTLQVRSKMGHPAEARMA